MGWSRAESTAAFSIALLMAAWARVESLPALYLIWAAVGVTMAAVLYEPAFAVLAKWFVRDRERGFTILTLAAGLASTIFNPISSLLVASLIDVTRSAGASGVEDAPAAPTPIRIFMKRF